MTITAQDLWLYCGDSETIDVDLTAADGGPFTLAPGGMIKWRLSFSAYDTEGESLIRKDLGSGILIEDGSVEISLTSFDTASLKPGVYWHQLSVFEGSEVATAMCGNVVMRPSLRMPQTTTATATLGAAIGLRCDGDVVHP